MLQSREFLEKLGGSCVLIWLSFSLLVARGQATEPANTGVTGSPSSQTTSLINAIKRQKRSLIPELVQQAVDVNAPQADGATALHWAVHRDDLRTVKLLIESGANVEAKNDHGVTPLALACTNRNASVINALLTAGADPNAALLTGETPLMTAARSGALQAVGVLLSHGADVNAKEPVRRQTPLMWALGEKHTEVARKLIEHGADIHATTTMGFTPLLFAAREGDGEATRMLLDAGAYVNAVSNDKLSALHVATLRGHVKVATILLSRGAQPNADGPGYTPLHWAVGRWETELNGKNGIHPPTDHEWYRMPGVQQGKLELVKALLDQGADPNAPLLKNPVRFGFTTLSARPGGATPFALAAMAGDVTIMRMLIDHGADPSLCAENGVTPLMMAAGIRRNKAENVVPAQDSLAAVKLAVELGADVNARDVAGNTALHGAARLKSVEMIQFLVDHGAEVNVVNELGQSPAYIADHFWHASRHYPEDEPTAAGVLLRKLTLPAVVSDTLVDWAILPPSVRRKIESLLESESDRIASARERRKRNPVFRLDGSKLEE